MLLLCAFVWTYIDSYTTNCSAVKSQYSKQCCTKDASTQFKLDTPWMPPELLEELHTPPGGWKATMQYEGLDVPPSAMYAVDASLPDLRGLWMAVSVSYENGTVVPFTPYLKRVEQIGRRTTIVAGGIVHDCVADTFDGRVDDVTVGDFETRIEVLCLTKHDERGPVLIHSPIKPVIVPDGAGVERWIERHDSEDYLVQRRTATDQVLQFLTGAIQSEDLLPLITRFKRVCSVF